MKHIPFSQKNLTRLEVFGISAIIGIIILLGLPKLLGSDRTTRKQNHAIARASLNTKIHVYYKLNNQWPTSVSQLPFASTKPQHYHAKPTTETTLLSCDYDTPWQIDPKTHQISTSRHAFHE